MNSFLKTLLLFLAVPMVPYIPFAAFVMPGLLEKANGPSMETQITKSFHNAKEREYTLVILGNSRLYRGLNPDEFKMPSYNFSNDNDSYNQLYYKLVWADKSKDLKYVILGMDYFQFGVFSDRKNYVYNGLLGEGYAADYESRRVQLKHYLEFLDPKKITAIIPKKNIPYLKPNGQFIYPGSASESDRVERDIRRLEIQEKYFEKILAHCKANGIRVFLCMPPTRLAERREYNPEDILEFRSFVARHLDSGTVYLDYSEDSSYAVSDFTDITHLNEAAANRFSRTVSDTVMHFLNSRAP